MNFWTRLSKRDKVLWGSIAAVVVVAIILVVWLVIRLRAAGEPITNTATVTWDDATGTHTATSNTVQTEVLANATSIVYSLQNVGSRDQSSTVTLTIYNVGGTTPIETHSVICANVSGTAQGSVQLAVTDGTYDFGIKETTHLSRKIQSIAYSSSNPPTLTFSNTLLGGDLMYNDDEVNALDYTNILINWGRIDLNPPNNPSDINRDTETNSLDYASLLMNWGKTGELR